MPWKRGYRKDLSVSVLGELGLKSLPTHSIGALCFLILLVVLRNKIEFVFLGKLQTVGQTLKTNSFTGIFKDFATIFKKFIWYLKSVYLAELLVVAASAINKKLSKVKHSGKGHLVRYHAYFNNLQIFRWLHLSISLLGIPLCCDLLSRRIDQKNFPLWQQLTELH